MTENVTGSEGEGSREVKSSGQKTAADLSEKSGKKKKRYEIDIFRDWCKSCGICAAFCPRKCISLDEEGSPVVDQPGQCTGCGWCEVHCPDFAISVREQKKKRARPVDEEQE